MPLPRPLNNNALIEVIREDSLVSRSDDNESMKRGILINVSFIPVHLTASAGFDMSNVDQASYKQQFKTGHIVRWEEFANEGQTFEEDGKTYALIPWWRLISVEESL